MKSIISEPNDFNIYCTDADSIHHSLNSVKASELLRQIKICSLLGKHVYISGGHIFENSETVKLLRNNPLLLQSGIVVIGLRDDCRDFDDLFDMQKSLGKDLLINSKDVPKFLDNNTSFIMRWSAPQTQPRFKEFLLTSVGNPQSTLRKRLRYRVPHSCIRELEKELDELDPKNVTREALQRLVAKHIPRGHKAFMHEVNLLYYIAGSSDRIPHLSNSLFEDLSKGYINSLDHQQCPVPADKLFSSLLKETLVCEEVIDQMNINDLVLFREQHTGLIKRFRNKWWSTFGLNEQSASKIGDSYDILELQSLVIEEVFKEKKKLLKYSKTEKPIGISSLAIDCASVFAGPVTSAISFLMSKGASGSQKDALKHRFLKTHFVALTSRLRAFCMSRQAQHEAYGNSSEELFKS